MKISFRIETHFRFMHQKSYFSADFSTYTLKYVNKTFHFVNYLYFGHNERRFHSEFSCEERVKNPSLHDSESIFHSGSSVQSGMKNGMNSIRNELQLNPDSFNPLWSQQKRNEFDPDRNSIRIHVNTP